MVTLPGASEVDEVAGRVGEGGWDAKRAGGTL